MYIVSTKRTAFGAFGKRRRRRRATWFHAHSRSSRKGGALKDFTAPELGARAAKGALDALGVSAAETVDSVVWGNVQQR